MQKCLKLRSQLPQNAALAACVSVPARVSRRAFNFSTSQPSKVEQASHVVRAAPPASAPIVSLPEDYNPSNLGHRLNMLRNYFPNAIGVDDFMSRVEAALCAYGFTSDNSIAMTNLCRDEVTVVLKDKIEAIFGASFNTNGLGAVLTCGTTGIGAGLSHSPQCDDGRERYVFFSFPHIGIDADGVVGSIQRPGRPGDSCACGAIAKCLGQLKADGVAKSCKVPGVHDPMDPEYSILKQRLARRIRHEKLDVESLSLVGLTSVAERTITDDLEYLIERVVNTERADYAVVTGIQVHNWGGDSNPHLEFIVPSRLAVCVNGEKTYLDLTAIPPSTPRAIQMFAERSMANVPLGSPSALPSQYSHTSTLVAIPTEYLSKRIGTEFVSEYLSAPVVDVSGAKPNWMVNLESEGVERDATAPSMESSEIGTMPVHTTFTDKGIVIYFGEKEEPVLA